MATSKPFDFLTDGYKLICIAGYVNGNPIWREVGTLTLNKKGQPHVTLDVTFNPAGVYREDPQSSNVMLHVKPRTPYQNNREKQEPRQSSHVRKQHREDFEDDIPF